ncbi:hypothetical protein [Arundinibacter roseus]|uniref:DUF2029 domain-containing protein n=1 Tax=Arundinibacter roseus TaxID=2070510 RepID=A0A4R4K0Q3_9BACT|nr:hypothetical protein [Arundinibacter roseus]TDB60877.1 hypothetical protein EZE20_20760 [Arundinibacter roseus]
MNLVLIKSLLSVLLVLTAGVILWKKEYLTQRLKDQRVTRMLALGWLLFRVVPFLLVYVAAGFAPTSDVNGFWDEGSKASMGQVVYRDFWSPYSPFFAYFLGIWLKIWYDPRMIVLTMTVMDALALWATWHLYRSRMSAADFLYKALLYYVLPGSLILCVVGAQEDVWMWLLVVAAYLFRQRTGRVEVYAAILAIGLLLTKAIFILILVPLFFLEKEKIRFTVIMVAIGALTLAILYPLVGMEFMQPLDEADTLRAPNLLSVLNPLFFNSIGVGQKFWNWAGLVVSVGLGSWTAWRLRTADFSEMISRTWVTLYATMMVVQQSAYSNYIFLFLIPLLFVVIDWRNRTQVGLLLVFNILCVVHPSYWWRLGMPKYLTPADIVASGAAILDYLMQVAIVALTIYFVRLAGIFSKNQHI